MPTRSQVRKRRQDQRDYTQEPFVRWFIYLLVVVAAIIIIRTLTADRVNETGRQVEKNETYLAGKSFFTYIS